MRFFMPLVILATFSINAFAMPVQHDFLGQYQLAKPDKASKIQKADFIYNNDNVLVVVTNRSEQEYEVNEAAEDGVIYEGSNEPNCDGDEPQCWYDSATSIRLKTINVDGRQLPQLTITITVSNAWDEVGKDDITTTYVLNWTKPLSHAIPFYVNTQTPAELDQLSKSCRSELKNLEHERGAGYINVNDVCPYVWSAQLREPFDEALLNYLRSLQSGRNRRKVEKVSAEELSNKVFKPARALANKYEPKKANSPSRAKILAQIDLIEEFAARSPVIYTYKSSMREAMIVLVDPETKISSQFDIKVADKWM